MGLVGEENLAKTIYLALTSRLLDKQVSIGVKGHSSSGKSYTVEQVTRFFPPEAFLAFTAMSEKALIYSSEQYANRTIILYEVTAMRENVEDDMTSYFIRSLLSEGRIDYEVVTKDRDGSFTTHRITKEGPTNLVFTTTKTRVHAENETRFLSLSTNDSNEQTANVLKAIARAHNGNDLSRWVEFQRWLASDTAEREVVIPYAEALAELISPAAVRLRRDFSSILALIQAHAVLHQLSRGRDEQGRIVATVEDYDVVRELVADVITEGVGGAVSDTVRQTVEAVRVLMSQDVFMNTSTTKIAAHLKIDKSNAGRRLKVAADGGYVQNLETQRGLAAKWVVGDPLPDEVTLLPEAEVLYAQQPDVHASRAQHRNTSQLPDQDCCGVAPETEGIGNGDADGGEAEEDTAASTPSARSKTATQTAHRLRMRKKVIARLTRVGANGLYAEAMTDSFGLRGDRGVLHDVLAELVAEKLIAVVGRGNGDKFWVLDQHAACLAQKFHG